MCIRDSPKWIQRFDDLMKIEIKEVIDKDLRPKKEGLSMGEVIVSINKYTKGDAVIVTDVGQHQMVACRYAEFIRSKSNVTSGGLGTMGSHFPQLWEQKWEHQKEKLLL